jgi:hypothetical protein
MSYFAKEDIRGLRCRLVSGRALASAALRLEAPPHFARYQALLAVPSPGLRRRSSYHGSFCTAARIPSRSVLQSASGKGSRGYLGSSTVHCVPHSIAGFSYRPFLTFPPLLLPARAAWGSSLRVRVRLSRRPWNRVGSIGGLQRASGIVAGHLMKSLFGKVSLGHVRNYSE